MKIVSHIFILSTFMAGSLIAMEKMPIEYSSAPSFIPFTDNQNADPYKLEERFAAHQSQDVEALKISLLEQRKQYEAKISYLEKELKKSRDLIVMKSKKFEQAQLDAERKHKLEKIAQTKEMMKYQRELEKVRPDKNLKETYMAHAEMAIEMRKAQERVAQNSKNSFMVLDQYKEYDTNTPKRLPASVEK